jgi:hypothetical protein
MRHKENNLKELEAHHPGDCYFLVFQVLGKLSSRIVADLSPERQTVHALTRSHVFQNDASHSIQPDDGGILSGGFTGDSGVPLFSAVLPSGSHFG